MQKKKNKAMTTEKVSVLTGFLALLRVGTFLLAPLSDSFQFLSFQGWGDLKGTEWKDRQACSLSYAPVLQSRPVLWHILWRRPIVSLRQEQFSSVDKLIWFAPQLRVRSLQEKGGGGRRGEVEKMDHIELERLQVLWPFNEEFSQILFRRVGSIKTQWFNNCRQSLKSFFNCYQHLHRPE